MLTNFYKWFLLPLSLVSTSSAMGRTNDNEYENEPYRPYAPLVMCNFLPEEFIHCDEPIDHKGNETARNITGHGCLKFGGVRFEDVETTRVQCKVLDGIHCHGERNFLKPGVPCIKYTGHFYSTTLIYSVLLGFLGMDRFCLGHTGTAVGKLLTLGGLGVWWIVDLILLIKNHLLPEDGSNWNPYV